MSERLEAEVAARVADESRARRVARREKLNATRPGRTVVAAILALGAVGVSAGLILLPGTNATFGWLAFGLACIAGSLVTG